MGVRLSAVNGSQEIRHLAVDWCQLETNYDTSLEVVADADGQTICAMACSLTGWLQVSVDAGAHWTPVGTDPTTGVSLGPLAANERKAIVLRVNIPAATSVRTKAIELYLGLGT